MQIELEIKINEKKLRNLDKTAVSNATKFDLSRCVRLVPPVSEREADKYFQQFEKVAENVKWSKNM